ncbi:helix-turn-helix domain-containing protein [Streptomyces sp. NPDC033538]|uniref:helix-turn-helix domain-containing protein n=1 Tax=Streptomyces sp. NPDC033538 TaxID=3155367 RepID=UPI0033DA1242
MEARRTARRSKSHPHTACRQTIGREREEISRGIGAGESARRLAEWLGVFSSTVSRETARNGGRYRHRAASAYERGRPAPKEAGSPNVPLYAPGGGQAGSVLVGRGDRRMAATAAIPVTPPCRSRMRRSTSPSTTLAE